MLTLRGRRRHADHRLAARYIDDLVVLSATHAWTYLRVPNVTYEFLTDDNRVRIADDWYLALASLAPGSDPVDMHLIVTSRPLNVATWRRALDDRALRNTAAPGWGRYSAEMAELLGDSGFVRKEVYLGVCLGERRQQQPSGSLLAPLHRAVRGTERALGYDDDVVSDAEISHWHARANDIHRTLGQSRIRATRAHPNAVAWLITRPLYPDMECPLPTQSTKRVWGPGEIEALAEGHIANGHRHLGVTQAHPAHGGDTTGYTATLCFSRFPDTLYIPQQEPWIHYASALGFPVDLSSRFQVVPARRVRRDVSHKLSDAKDQATHIAETGAMVPLEIQEQYERATNLEYTISRDQTPWVYGRHRMRVWADTPERLHARVGTVIEHYRDLGIDVVWPTGDQMDLLQEAMPGDRVRGSAYYQRHELSIIGGGMPTASGDVGDRVKDGRGWVGPYLGETTSRVRTPTFYSPLVAATRNDPSGCAIIGQPGAGKSFCAFTLAYQMAMMGAWVIYIDPKADAKPMATLPGLPNPKVFDMRDGHDGMLDPFGMADSAAEVTLLALDTLMLLLGGQKRVGAEREEALMRAIEAVVAAPNPSLGRVVDTLIASDDVHARAVGSVLHTIRQLPFARLCFAPAAASRIRPEDGLTIITLLGLDMPDAATPSEDYDYGNRLAVSVLYLLTRYTRRLMLNLDKSHPKAILIDEAWAITATPQGAKLIPEIARMGRSHNTALTLVTQNAKDLMDEKVTNSVSTVFAFRSTKVEEIRSVLDLLGVEADESHIATVRELRNGECLMRDPDGRVARVQISDWNTPMKRAFDTNPDTRDPAA